MADISKIKLPDGATYNIKDTVARSQGGGANVVLLGTGANGNTLYRFSPDGSSISSTVINNGDLVVLSSIWLKRHPSAISLPYTQTLNGQTINIPVINAYNSAVQINNLMLGESATYFAAYVSGTTVTLKYLSSNCILSGVGATYAYGNYYEITLTSLIGTVMHLFNNNDEDIPITSLRIRTYECGVVELYATFNASRVNHFSIRHSSGSLHQRIYPMLGFGYFKSKSFSKESQDTDDIKYTIDSPDTSTRTNITIYLH